MFLGAYRGADAREEGGWTEVVVRVHGSGRVQDGFGIQTKQGQLLQSWTSKAH